MRSVIYIHFGLQRRRRILHNLEVSGGRKLEGGKRMKPKRTLSVAGHNRAAAKLQSLHTSALDLLNYLNGTVVEEELGHAKILLNVITQLNLQLRGVFDRDYQNVANPYPEPCVWFADNS